MNRNLISIVLMLCILSGCGEKASVCKSVPGYTIVKINDISTKYLKLLDIRVSIDTQLSKSEIELICKDIIESQKYKKKGYNALGFSFYLPNTDTNGKDTAAMVKWAPHGEWDEVGSMLPKDYSDHVFNITIGHKRIPKHTIVKKEDISYLNVKRLNIRILVDTLLSKSEIELVCNEIIDSEKYKRQGYNALSFLFYLPNTDTKGQYTAAMAEWAPYGEWNKAGNMLANDYSNHAFKITIAEKVKYADNTGVPLNKRMQIFYSIAAIQDSLIALDPNGPSVANILVSPSQALPGERELLYGKRLYHARRSASLNRACGG